jgi:hypothetical protein
MTVSTSEAWKHDGFSNRDVDEIPLIVKEFKFRYPALMTYAL